jgi:hypothetical protein
MSRDGWVLGLLLLSGPVPVESQEETRLARGTRIRVTAPVLAMRPIIGTLDTLDEERVTWTPEHGDSILSWPRASLERLEISQGRRANTWRGALLGALSGAGAGLIVGFVAGEDECPENGLAGLAAADCLTRAEAAVGGTVLGAVGGGLVGLLIGSGSKSERWRSVF